MEFVKTKTDTIIMPWLKAVSLILALSLYSSHIFAGPPAPFGSNSCPTNFVCKVNTVSDGMVQRMLTDNLGTIYFQVTIIDEGSERDGSFAYESFINASKGNTLTGVSAKLDISQTWGTSHIDYSTILNMGWASTDGPAIDISMIHTWVNFYDSFSYLQTQNTLGQMTGYSYELFQSMNSSQNFALRRMAGDFVSSAGSVTLEGSMGAGGPGGGGIAGIGPGGGMGPPTGGRATGVTVTPGTTTMPSGTTIPSGTTTDVIAPGTPGVVAGMPGVIIGGVKKPTARLNSAGASYAGTISSQSSFITDAAGYGSGGVIAGAEIGDPQTGAPDTAVGADANQGFLDSFGQRVGSNTLSISLPDNNTSNNESTGTNVGGSGTGEIISDGVASGPDSGVFAGGEGANGTVSWNIGDEVQVIWIGLGGIDLLDAYQKYDNLTTEQTATGYISTP